MKIYEIGTGYTSIPAKMGAATEIVVEELTTSMLTSGHDVTIIDIADTNRMPTSLPISEVKIPSFLTGTDTGLGVVHKLKRVVYSIALVKRIKRLINDAREPVLLHFHNQYNLFFFLKLTTPAIRSKVKILYTVHSYIWSKPWSEIEDTVRKRYFQEIEACRKADVVFVLNDEIGRKLTEHFDVNPNNIVKIDNGVNVNKYNRNNVNPNEANELLSTLNIPGKRYVVQVGSVCQRKNQLGTLQRLIPVMKRRPDIAYVFAGGIIEQEHLDAVYALAEAEGISDRVVYAGEISPGKELNRLYSGAVASVMNSSMEAFCLVTAESLSAGTPVFVNNTILNLLPFHSRNVGQGILEFEASDFEATFDRLLDDPEYFEQQSKRGRTLIEQTYSWDKIAGDYLRFGNSTRNN